jgi:hypothetical protein
VSDSEYAEPSGSATGPRYCAVCGAWPASETMLGLRCHLCHCHDIATAHPVPLPENHEMLRDLARIGVPCAAEKLTINNRVSGPQPAQETL